MTKTEVFCDRCHRKLNNFKEFNSSENEYDIWFQDPDNRKNILKYVLCKDCMTDVLQLISGKTTFDFKPLNSDIEVYQDWEKRKYSD